MTTNFQISTKKNIKYFTTPTFQSKKNNKTLYIVYKIDIQPNHLLSPWFQFKTSINYFHVTFITLYTITSK